MSNPDTSASPIDAPPELVRRVRDMLAAHPAPSLELGITFHGERYARIIAAPAGRGRKRDKFLIVAPDLPTLFRVLSEATAE